MKFKNDSQRKAIMSNYNSNMPNKSSHKTNTNSYNAIRSKAKVNYNVMRDRINNLQEFKGNSARGVIEDGKYNVYSYSTLIYSYNLNDKKVEYFDNTSYSSTTSKLQNILKNSDSDINDVKKGSKYATKEKGNKYATKEVVFDNPKGKKYTITEMKEMNKKAGEYFFLDGWSKGDSNRKVIMKDGINYLTLTKTNTHSDGSKYSRRLYYKFDGKTGKLDIVDKDEI